MKYIPSMMVGQLAGSAGSTTASHNRYGSYFRNRVTPVNTSTDARSAVRTAFGSWSNFWKGLTQPQRDGWIALGTTVTLQDKQGVSFNPTGFNLFVSANQENFGLGAALVDDAPAWDPPTAPTIGTVLFAETADIGSAMTLGFDPTAPAGTSYVIEASAPVSPGVNMLPRSMYKRVHIVAPAGTTPATILTGYQAVHGTALPLGTKVFFRLKAVVEATGQSSPWAYGSQVVEVDS